MKGIIIIFLLGILSCEKEVESELEVINPLFKSTDVINYSIDDNVMIFESLDDLESMLIFVSQLDPSLFEEFEEYLNIKSFRSHCQRIDIKPPIYSELLCLLNEEKMIVVDGYRFEYDFTNEEVTVAKFLDGVLKSTPRTLSWDEDIVNIVFNGAALKSVTGFTACSNKSTEGDDWELTNTTVNTQLKYNNIPLAYALKAIINMSPNRTGVYLWVGIGDDTSMPTGCETYYQTRNTCTADPEGHVEGYYWERNLNIHGPSTTVRLDGYDAWAQYSYVDEYVVPNDEDSYILHLSDHVSDISCD